MKSAGPLLALAVLASGYMAHATFAPPFSGTLKRPVLFVHGVSSNGYGTWGFQRADCRKPAYSGFTYDHQVTTNNGTVVYFLRYDVACEDGTVYSGVSQAGTGNPPGVVTYYYTHQGLSLWIGKPYLDGVWSGRSHDNHPYRGWVDAWKQGITNGYMPRSTMATLAGKYGLDTRFNVWNGSFGINHNGLEFFNLSTFDETTRKIQDPWEPPWEQSPRLYQRLEAVLTEYYPDWRTNAERKIDLVAHSQGGLVIRDAIKNNRGAGSDNPINHINHVITMDTPHLGTAFAHNKNGVPSMDRMRDWLLFDFTKDFKFDVLWGAMEVNIGKESGIVDMVVELNENSQHFLYPCGFKPARWNPANSGVLSGPLSLDPRDNPGQELPWVIIYWSGGTYYSGANISGSSVTYSNPIGTASNPWRTDCKYQVMVNEPNPYVPWPFTLLELLMVDNAGNLVAPNERLEYERKYPDCSEYLQGLTSSGYPRWPKGGFIPMTALSGAINPANVNRLIDDNKEKLFEQCETNQFGIIDPDFVSWNGCSHEINNLINAFKARVADLSTDWLPNSDFVVDVASQQGWGLFKPEIHPFRAKAMTPINPDYGILHMHMGKLGEDLGIFGASYHGEEVYQALENPPKHKAPLAAIDFLLQ